MVVFVLSGLWHGANWTFVAWGALNGCYVVFGHLTKSQRNRVWEKTGIPRLRKMNTALQILITFSLIALSRVFFRSEDFSQAVAIFTKMAGFSGSLASESITMLAYSFFAIAVLLAVEFRREFFPEHGSLSNHPSFLVRNGWYAFLVLLILIVGVYDGGQFIYFQF
jgi:D-alanyl-lipoteichoic acid acyltransferase DltB (MBOAT superfamily)